MAEVNVFLTVDVECSIGGAFVDASLSPVGAYKRIFGRFFGKEYGLPLMCRTAKDYGFRLVFFVEAFHALYFRQDSLCRVVDFCLEQGQDVQVHLHPNYRNFSAGRPLSLRYSDLCAHYGLEEQVELIGRAREMLLQCGVPSVKAFRAGCFGADQNTLQALRLNGFLIDSSYNQAYLRQTCFMEDRGWNDVAEEDGIFEFPVTQFEEASGLRPTRSRPLDINGTSFLEARHLLEQCRRGQGPKNVTFLLHSFSFIKPYDVQYNRVRVRRNVIDRFQRLCRFLAENPSSFKVRTFGELSEDELQAMVPEARHMRPKVPFWATWGRLAEQAMDRWL